jgi:proton-dependent oligopeptide transporter, POT family
MTAQTATALKQPPVFKLSFYTAMCERFGFYVLSFLLVLYAKGEFNLSDAQAFTMFGTFTALSYLTTAIGGYLADNIFGIRRCIITGLFLEGLGLTLLAIPSHFIFIIALAFIIIGVGLFKTGPTHLMARSYEDKDPRIDSGFTLYYMAINIGSFISSLLTGIVQRYYGWHMAFLMGGIAVLIGLIFYFIFRKTAQEPDSDVGKKKLPIKKWLYVILGLVVAGTISAFLMAKTNLAAGFLTFATVLLFIYFIYEIVKSPKSERLKIVACLSLILMGLVFFVLYYQAFTSMVLFINRSVVRQIMGFEIPTVAYFALNPFWVVVLGPILAMVYNSLGKKGKDLAITTKFPLGLFITSLCFFTLVASTYFVNANAQTSSLWVILAYFFYTLGEMLVSALGVAMVTHIAPKRMYGVMMGTWFVSTSLAAALSGVFAGIANIPETLHDPFAILQIYSNAFLKIGVASLICTAIAFAAGPYIKRIAKLD